MSRPILKEFRRSRTTKPPPKIKMSPTRPDFNSFSLEGKKRYAAFYQPKRNTPASTVRLPRKKEMREDPGPEQVGWGNDILVDCWERPLYSKYAFLGALRSAAQMVPYEVSIGLILIVRLVSTFGSAKAIARIARTSHMQGNLHVWFWPGTPVPVISSEIVMAQKQIWSGIPLFPKLNRAPSDLPEAEAESVAGYNVEYARDAILNSSLFGEANVPGSRDSF
ncbi:hypothetical protein IEQ34_023286 [Dendrobium chrysotoxum]|uniref:Uncharacterized protein n=1 Tax=Dendrobium chrysotoxum TaxID=161865 RepID=A0AAV7FX00_DENCH|nr:hypothetical protein IEQ34_023286 [Dendrobium chrysotoxum]